MTEGGFIQTRQRAPPLHPSRAASAVKTTTWPARSATLDPTASAVGTLARKACLGGPQCNSVEVTEAALFSASDVFAWRGLGEAVQGGRARLNIDA